MSFKDFATSRVGFAAITTLVCGVSYFLGVGLSIDARIREERKVVLNDIVERRVEQLLQKEVGGNADHGTKKT
jgi:hypothetical protein